MSFSASLARVNQVVRLMTLDKVLSVIQLREKKFRPLDSSCSLSSNPASPSFQAAILLEPLILEQTSSLAYRVLPGEPLIYQS